MPENKLVDGMTATLPPLTAEEIAATRRMIDRAKLYAIALSTKTAARLCDAAESAAAKGAEIAGLRQRAELAEVDAGRYRALRSQMTFYNTAESPAPALASVSRRIWYHATDCLDWPLDAVADAAIAASQPPAEGQKP